MFLRHFKGAREQAILRLRFLESDCGSLAVIVGWVDAKKPTTNPEAKKLKLERI
jgi:hypothetical protein